jgi:hypothetical protein
MEKNMKNLVASILALSISAPAFAITCTNTGEKETDNMTVEFNIGGTFEVSQYEAHYSPAQGQAFVIQGDDWSSGEVNAVVAMIQDQTVKASVEGDESTAQMTAVFVYNPAQNAGRLTAIVDGQTLARNLLFENCQ